MEAADAPEARKAIGTTSKVGNLTADPELQFSKSGNNPYVRVNMAVNVPGPNNDWENKTTEYYTISCFKSLAENVAQSLRKGDRVVVTGRAELRDWTTKDGEKRTDKVIVATGMGPDLRFATAEVTRQDGRTINEMEAELDF
jgi:single-strand DNA-binding protein